MEKTFLKPHHWNTINGKWHGLCAEGAEFVCPRKDEHKIPDECERGEQFTLQVVIREYSKVEI